MAKKRAKQAGADASGSAQTRRQRLRRDALRVRRIEVVLRANIGDDAKTSDWLDSLPSGTISDFVRCAVEEKIAREIVARNKNIDVNNAMDDLRAQIAELQEENTKLRLGGSVPFEEKATTAIEDREKALSGKLKKLKMGFAGL